MGGGLILQRRLLDGNPVGLSLGVTYIRNYQRVGDLGFLSNYSEFYTSSAGIRTVVFLSSRSVYGSSQLFLYGTGSINYDFNVKVIYPKVGVAMGFY